MANSGSNDVSVINTATNTVVATVNVGLVPIELGASPDGAHVYVPNSGSNTVSVINTATNTVVATVNVGLLPQAVAVSPDGSRAYVANVNSNTVSVINTATNTVVATVDVGSRSSRDRGHFRRRPRLCGQFWQQQCFRHRHRHQHGGGDRQRRGSFLRASSSARTATLAYVANRNSNTVSVINTATNTVVSDRHRRTRS